jgi:hypothetical protein
VGFVLALVLAAGAAPAAGADSGVEGVSFTATIDGRPLAEIDANEPLPLQSDGVVELDVVVRNATDADIRVRSVHLEGTVLRLSFFSYETRVDLDVPAGQEADRSVVFDAVDLDGQATGLLPAALTLLDDERQVLASDDLAVDVQGSLRSVYGIFGLLVAAITVLLLVGAFTRLAAHRLPSNRWSRAVRFGAGGIGLGLTAVFTLSALRLLTPSAQSSLSVVVLVGSAFAVFGYLTPNPVRARPADILDGPGADAGEGVREVDDTLVLAGTGADASSRDTDWSGKGSGGSVTDARSTVFRGGDLPEVPLDLTAAERTAAVPAEPAARADGRGTLPRDGDLPPVPTRRETDG